MDRAPGITGVPSVLEDMRAERSERRILPQTWDQSRWYVKSRQVDPLALEVRAVTSSQSV